ncbi:hypothetical protein Q4Q34_12475 [Flavivirga abyssicola]|uniref:hypothetical protein n=1 Tax=Flavivirga abyssicola TaxID=3063533 RepID=UPI0026DEB9B9|nr:hypothetical protein [Flavivirga sp. MEBiC07777]WVK12038.1 hypothetical protein Q4Q34_12475 [Flavivirga sp. MEBiC07777]
MDLLKRLKENHILIVVYILIFVFLIFQEAIFSPDTYGYLKARPNRHPGYVIFIKAFEFIFTNYFAKIVVGIQLVLGMASVHFFLKRISGILSFNKLIRSLLLIVLLFPFFPPLYVANNICSEGLSYPLYLIFITLSLEIVLNEKKKLLLFMSIAYILLVLTRGQFIIASLIFAFTYLLKHRRNTLIKSNLKVFFIILFLPLFVIMADKTYHKLKDGLFISTPFSFINASAAAFYVSNDTNFNQIENGDYKAIFKKCYKYLSEKDLLLSRQKQTNYKTYYNHFHNHIPQICNQTIHQFSLEYYIEKHTAQGLDINPAVANSYWQSELAAQSLFFTLVKLNFKSWCNLFFANIKHAFKGVILFFLLLGFFFYSLFKLLYSKTKDYYILFILSALILSNAFIVCFASHSIIRYLFYNYSLIFITFVMVLKIIKQKNKRIKSK